MAKTLGGPLAKRSHAGILILVDYLRSEISYLAGILWIAVKSLQDTCKMVDGSSLACIIFMFLVGIPCARL